jgi:large repetitive protein
VLVRTWTAEDPCGLKSSCQQRITIRDVTAPVITCPADLTISCNDSRLPANTGQATATDNCTAVSGLNISYSDNTTGLTGCNGTGVLLRTWRATDACGNQATCVQRITIRDVTAPVITCPPNITISCSDSRLPAVTGTATATDNCSAIPAIAISYTDNTAGLTGCNGTGVLVRTWRAVDACGNQSTCEQRITIQDLTPPAITCPPPITIKCTESSLPANTGRASATDNCTPVGSILISYTDVVTGALDCSGPGSIARTWRAEDACGRVSTCVQTITVETVPPPVISCPPNITISCSDSRLPAATGTATATAACTTPGEIEITYSDNTSGLTGCNGTGVLVRTWTAEDPCGLKSSCQQRITIRDVTAPVITCPANLTISCSDSRLPAVTGTATATDNCSQAPGIAINYTDNIAGLTGCSGTGVLVRTWRAVDACGNQSTCEQRITIQDLTPPVISCPPPITIKCTESSLPANTGQATATDNCTPTGSILISYTDVVTGALDCSAPGSIARTWRAQDACGRVSTCVQTITLEAVPPPVITCPPNITISCSDSRLPAATGTATATAACTTPGEIKITYSDNTSGLTGCNGTGVLVRTWTAEDPCGLKSSCQQRITIQDLISPVITCPPPIAIKCTESSLPANTGQATATDNCTPTGSILISYTDVVTGALDCSGPGSIARTWRAEDACGRVSTCVQTITVETVPPPVITCPPNITISCSDSRLPAASGTATATTACTTPGEIEITYSDNTSDLTGCNGTGVLVRTWTAVDPCGLTSTCDQRITIRDVTPPAITCPPAYVTTCDKDYSPAAAGQATATDLCGAVTITYADVVSGPGNCTGVTTIARTWTARDACENTSTCVQTITVNPTAGPTIICPDGITISCTDNRNPSNTGSATASTACALPGEIQITYSDVENLTGCSGTGTIVRTWRAQDPCGGVSTCTQTITIQDSQGPVLSGVPGNVTVSCDAMPSPPSVTATDNCDAGPIAVSLSEDITPGSCTGNYVLVRTWSAEDECGNMTSRSQTITVRDTQGPQLSGVPGNVTVSCDAVPSAPVVSATDNCDAGPISVLFSEQITPGTCPDSYSILRTWTAEDDCGNETSRSQTITVRDNVNPVISCPSGITVACFSDALPAFSGTATATDNCTKEVEISYTDNTAGMTCGGTVGTLVRTWRAEDACGNTATCTQSITIQPDNTKPVISCPPDIAISCGSSMDPDSSGRATATDNCVPPEDILITYQDGALGNIPEGCPGTGTIERTWRAEDKCGNSATCVQIITIIDEEPPLISCPPSSCDAGTDPDITGEATAVDNCTPAGSILIVYTDAGGPAECGPAVTLRTWTATDDCGNTSSCVQPLNLVETDPPAITCPADIGISCEESTDPANTGKPVVSDACTAERDIGVGYSDSVEEIDDCGGYQITRQWSIKDACGNTAGCEQVIKVTDEKAPQIVCPKDTTISCTAERGPDKMGFATATDNCTSNGDIKITYSDDLSNLSGCDGFIRRTWRARDLCGNESTCVQIITISETGGRIAGTMAAPDAGFEADGLKPVITLAFGGRYFEILMRNRLAWRIGFHPGPALIEPHNPVGDAHILQASGDVSALLYGGEGRWLYSIGTGMGLARFFIPGTMVYENPFAGTPETVINLYMHAGIHYRFAGNLHLSLESRLGYGFGFPNNLNINTLQPSISSGFYWRYGKVARKLGK